MGVLVTLIHLLWASITFADTAITHARVFTGISPEPRELTTLLISNGEIKAIGTDLDYGFSTDVVDARGKVVTAGLFDSYTQLGIQEIELEDTTVDSEVKEYALGPSFDVRYGINPDSVLLPVNLMAGVTHAVVAPKSGNDIFAGWGAVINLARRSEPLVQTHTGLFATWGSAGGRFAGGSRSAAVIRLQQGFAAAKKINASYRPDPRFYSREDLYALKEFLRSKRPLVLKLDRASDIRTALEIKRRFKIPMVILGAVEGWKVAQELAGEDVPVIIDPLANLPTSFDALGARMDNGALMSEAGVRVAFTSEETQNARWLRQIAGNAVANGMSWHRALQAITSIPAAIWGLDDRMGTLEAGKQANLVIWSGDPLELNTIAERVMVQGDWVPMQSRQTRLRERYKDLSGDLPFQYR